VRALGKTLLWTTGTAAAVFMSGLHLPSFDLTRQVFQ